MYMLLLIIFILFFIFIVFKSNSNFYIEFFDVFGLNKDIKIYEEDCMEKCNARDCEILYEKKRVLNNCLKCNAEKNKCFSHSIIGGTCNDCDEETENKMNCYQLDNFGCTNPYDLQSEIGIAPYYVQVPDDNINSPYNKKCVFCWNILDDVYINDEGKYNL